LFRGGAVLRVELPRLPRLRDRRGAAGVKLVMIHFNCTHCGWPVRVADAYAGKPGRCPSCGGVVTIPGQPAPGADQQEGIDNVAALAAAMQGDEEGGGLDSGQGVPPPPAPGRAPMEDVHLPDSPKDISGETDILPAEQLIDAKEAKRRRHAARERRARASGHGLGQGKRKMITARLLLIVSVSILVLAIAAMAVLLLTSA